MRTLVVIALTLVACTGGSGIDGDKRVVDLSDSEIDDLCNYVIAEQGDGGEETCTDEDGTEYTVPFPDFDECVDSYLDYSDDCPSTVHQEEECAEKLGDDPCSDPAACHASDDC